MVITTLDQSPTPLFAPTASQMGGEKKGGTRQRVQNTWQNNTKPKVTRHQLQLRRRKRNLSKTHTLQIIEFASRNYYTRKCTLQQIRQPVGGPPVLIKPFERG